MLQHIGQYLTPILVPLLFAGLTSGFVLPLVQAKAAALPPEALWPVALIIMAIAVAQGIAIYYAGTNNGVWALVTVGGFFLFLIVGSTVIFGLMAGLVLFVILLGVSVVLARLYIHVVTEGFVDITYGFGKYSRTLYPGLNIMLPWEDVHTTLNIGETQWPCPKQRVQLSQEYDVSLGMLVSYHLMPEEAHLAVTQLNDWEKSVRELCETTLQTHATQFTPDDFFSWSDSIPPQPLPGLHWERVNLLLLRRLREQASLWGVQINRVNIHDVELLHHTAITLDTGPVARISSTEPASPSQPTVPSTAVVPVAKSEPQPKEAPRLTPVMTSAPILSGKNFKEEVLVRLYKEVKEGRISDAETIRSYAKIFDSVAKDPSASKTMFFDVERAARNLHAQASRYEASHSTVVSLADD